MRRGGVGRMPGAPPRSIPRPARRAGPFRRLAVRPADAPTRRSPLPGPRYRDPRAAGPPAVRESRLPAGARRIRRLADRARRRGVPYDDHHNSLRTVPR
ncbi:hypothetical protein GCM10010389_50590 [Streptomyces echinoruber]|uniref:Uncharacterized protein n=1 Tax=Streptomyces echinoruber TaxID=68898 RepID=A0A918VL00_9ACTN|nr:hypothetical protein GCM10010389_50590 [Streptomyces echinoruber]